MGEGGTELISLWRALMKEWSYYHYLIFFSEKLGYVHTSRNLEAPLNAKWRQFIPPLAPPECFLPHHRLTNERINTFNILRGRSHLAAGSKKRFGISVWYERPVKDGAQNSRIQVLIESKEKHFFFS